MESLAAAETAMQAETDERRVGEQAARLAMEILHSYGAVVVAGGPEQEPRLIGFEGMEADVAEALARSVARGEVFDDACVVELPGTSGVAVGVLVVMFAGGCPDDGFTEPAARLFATKVARSLEQVRVVEALTNAAVRDVLTGVGNRRHADALLASLHPGDAIVLVDLDRFKDVNDVLGHGTGDDVLVAAGHYLRQHLRQSDDVARLGGDEFLVILRQIGDAVGAAERLVDGWRGTAPVTTFSAGVDVHMAGRSAAETMRRADTALYNAKRAGRDTVAPSTLSPGA
jgi:diguanylate cyclase (GGDEF)-like protein